MMRLSLSLAALLLAALALLACNSAEKKASTASLATPAKPVATASPDGVRRVTTAELKDLLAKGQAVVVDVRGEAAYKLGHIPGAKLIPTNEVLNRSGELPRDKTIVMYCS